MAYLRSTSVAAEAPPLASPAPGEDAVPPDLLPGVPVPLKLDGETATNAPLIRAPVSALIERMEDRSTMTLMSEGLAQLRGRVAAKAA